MKSGVSFPPTCCRRYRPLPITVHSTESTFAYTGFPRSYRRRPHTGVRCLAAVSRRQWHKQKRSDWKTLAIFGEGQGSGAYLWSSSSTCYSTSAFSATYSATTPYYCGLYALDVTNTSATSPTYMWHLMPTSAQAPYLGEAWSKAQVGRVKIGGQREMGRVYRRRLQRVILSVGRWRNIYGLQYSGHRQRRERVSLSSI